MSVHFCTCAGRPAQHLPPTAGGTGVSANGTKSSICGFLVSAVAFRLWRMLSI
jgi:hypothetical protein